MSRHLSDEVIKCVAEGLGIRPDQVSTSTRLGEKAGDIIPKIIFKTGKSLSWNSPKPMTVGDIMRQLDL